MHAWGCMPGLSPREISQLLPWAQPSAALRHPLHQLVGRAVVDRRPAGSEAAPWALASRWIGPVSESRLVSGLHIAL